MRTPHDFDHHTDDNRRSHRGHRGHGGHGGPRARRGGFGPGFGPGFGGGPGYGPGGPGFGPRGAGRGGRARKGDVRSAILSLLGEAPASGYGLMKAIGEKTQGAWRPSPGSVYPTLSQLVDEQLIEPTDPEAPRSDFRLTAAGQAHLAEHADQIAAAWDIASDDESGQLRGATMKLMGALRQFGAGATPDQQKRAADKVDALRKELYAILGE